VKRGILPWILVLFPLAFLRAQPRADSQEAAAKIWEQMIDAKGGRRHLYQIETIVQETHGYWIIFSRKFKSGAERGVTVYAFPDRVWSWYSGPIFGGSSHVADLSAGIGYYGFPNNDIRKTDDFRGDKQHLKETQLVYFNETQWLKPKLLRTLLGKSIPRKVEAIETDVDGERFDFWIDRKDHLPVKIIQYFQSPYHAGLEPGYTWDLSHYQQMNGIQIPRQISFTVLAGRPDTGRFMPLLNPKLREDLFTSPPRFEDGPDAWKPK
jgi:hypothetical protein